MPLLIVVGFIIMIDQLTKYYIQLQFAPGESIPIVQNIFHITYVLNPGAAFGMFEHKTPFFILVAIGMIAAVLFYYPRISPRWRLLRFGIGLLVGGAIGNVIDRIRSGYVVDFFDFRIWPVFNVADMGIVCGVACIIYTMARLSYEEDEAK